MWYRINVLYITRLWSNHTSRDSPSERKGRVAAVNVTVSVELLSRIRDHRDMKRKTVSTRTQGTRGPSLSSTWWVSQVASAACSPPSSLGRTGAARLRKSCRILRDTTTSVSSSFWGITLMKKPILLDFLKATTLGGGRKSDSRVRSGCQRRIWLPRREHGLTLDHPGSPGVQPAHRTQPQHLCQPAAAPW